MAAANCTNQASRDSLTKAVDQMDAQQSGWIPVVFFGGELEGGIETGPTISLPIEATEQDATSAAHRYCMENPSAIGCTVKPHKAKALADDAMADLCKFIGIAKENQQALALWNEYLKQERPLIEVSNQVDGQPLFFLSKPLASFIGAEVNHG